jgi:hypothetical protein
MSLETDLIAALGEKSLIVLTLDDWNRLVKTINDFSTNLTAKLAAAEIKTFQIDYTED